MPSAKIDNTTPVMSSQSYTSNNKEYSPYFSSNAHNIVTKNIDELSRRMTNVNYDDKQFLKMFMNDSVVKNLLECYDAIVSNSESNNEPENVDNIPLIKSLIKDLESKSSVATKSPDLTELLNLLSTNVHLKVLIEAHDTIAQEKFDDTLDVLGALAHDDTSFNTRTLDNTTNDFLPFYANPPSDAIRMIGVRKVNDEPLGITVKINENGDLEIARIMHGGLIDKQGLLHEGDIIKEVNGELVSTPDELQEKLKMAKGSVTLKVVPSYFDVPLASQVYMKALFTYDPLKDKLIPARDAGLAFEKGDILQIISQEDIHWWQARLVKAPNRKGIIPSLYLEERRKAFVPHEQDLSSSTWACGLIDRKKKKKFLFNAKEHTQLDRADLKLYEEVARMPPFQRKCLVLIGAEGVGRRSLKAKLLNLDPDRFGTTVPYTSRAMRETEVNGQGYYFESREIMEEEIKSGVYLEWGEYDNNLYGTKLTSIRQVIQSGKMCILDCSTKALKLISNQEFMPYIVFVKSSESVDDLYGMKLKAKNPAKFKNSIINQSVLNFDDYALETIIEESELIDRDYHAYFDFTIVNEDMNKCFSSLVETIDSLRAEPQWVPVTWLY